VYPGVHGGVPRGRCFVSLSDDAYIAIKHMIVTVQLPPEAVVDEVALQTELNIGRTPIREAIQRLERDQFVRVVPRRGVFVTSVNVDELSMLFETRSVIEPYAARLAAERGTSDVWDQMEKELVLGVSSGPELTLGVDRRCHELMWAAAGNRFLTDTLDMLYAQSERVWYLYVRDVIDMHDVLGEHEEMLAVLRSGNVERSGLLMANHVKQFHDEIRSVAK
jgi:DNA-binding GntR family transcriptional regulator